MVSDRHTSVPSFPIEVWGQKYKKLAMNLCYSDQHKKIFKLLIFKKSDILSKFQKYPFGFHLIRTYKEHSISTLICIMFIKSITTQTQRKREA